MKSASCRIAYRSVSCFLQFVVFLVTVCAVGCGGGSTSHSPGSELSGNTSVTVLTSSTANDRLSQFAVTFNSITLTNQAGKAVTVFATPQVAEFTHVNGTAEPLVTVSIPQGIYTSASSSIGYSIFTCLGLSPSSGNIVSSMFAYGQTPDSNVTVNVPSPITITGPAMGLSINMLVSQSASWTAPCEQDGLEPYSITPTFNITPVTFENQPTNGTNGKATNLQGLVASIAADGTLSVKAALGVTSGTAMSAPPRIWQVRTNGTTGYQGINAFSQLTAGMPVDMDVVVQADGSLLATRLAVYDTNTDNLNVRSGPLLYNNQSANEFIAFAYAAQGSLLLYGPGPYFNYSNAVFQTSGQLTNIQNLPFPASFTAQNMVAGQNVFVTTHALSAGSGHISAGTVTLLPQTINGTVMSVSNESNFATYTVGLGNYDRFPTFAVQAGQATLLTNPDTVVVYVDGNTQMLNTNPLAVGSLLRFNGLVFNDNGTLRMDCAQVNDGVPE